MHHGEKKGVIASRRLDLYLLVRGRYFIFLLPPIGNQWRRSPSGDAPSRGLQAPRVPPLVVAVVLVSMNKCIMEKKGAIASRRLDLYLLVRGRLPRVPPFSCCSCSRPIINASWRKKKGGHSLQEVGLVPVGPRKEVTACNFELRSSDENDTSALKHLPNANDMDVLGIKVLTLMCLGVMRLGFHSGIISPHGPKL
ncbi:hypothetical protein TNCV_2607461 [Trichonephila clavipes]|uniref:Uncharacterized protein n=1 Tax=Trichonephila clavipes TaxID=2585209 RepID=A0A8X6RTM4_TRICX|nr:hypothetical protein TNCV_2607461 [Trichonephila clavipes]